MFDLKVFGNTKQVRFRLRDGAHRRAWQPTAPENRGAKRNTGARRAHGGQAHARGSGIVLRNGEVVLQRAGVIPPPEMAPRLEAKSMPVA